MSTLDTFGVSAALTTPFAADGTIAVATLVAHARSCLDRGCDSVTLFGTTGEGASIGEAERAAVFDAFAAGGIPADRIVCGVAAAAWPDAAAQARDGLARGCRAVLIPPPFYFKNPSLDGLAAWYGALIGALGADARDVILYHIPSVTAVPLPLELILRLARDFPRAVAAVKDSGGVWADTEALLAARGDLAILVGDERDLARAVRLGAVGAISGMANLRPDRLRAMVDLGRDDPGMVELVRALLAHPVTPAVKALVAHMTGDAAWGRTRPPLEATPAIAAAALADLYDRVFPVA
ncbi:dihydrodipicolinate synthase family protein [Siculibacillus lacustris]|uniref:dihydrodipicolinate synthase family protein n=1 Tax=Siculibacillus lacustris TaxID=1549641 RepID=UPI001D1868FC|nr:dihydrodipicolinate synthase family protein [Siculibacillus lacustris]